MSQTHNDLDLVRRRGEQGLEKTLAAKFKTSVDKIGKKLT